MPHEIRLKRQSGLVQILPGRGLRPRLGGTIALEMDGTAIRAVVASIGTYPRSRWRDRVSVHEIAANGP
jgi:hypothetical protein